MIGEVRGAVCVVGELRYFPTAHHEGVAEAVEVAVKARMQAQEDTMIQMNFLQVQNEKISIKYK